jgi:hypothetical protein
MYLVISRWKARPGQEMAFQGVGKMLRELLRKQPGVKLVEGIEGPDCFYAVHVYESAHDYARIVQDENGPFALAAAEHGLEEVAEWLDSVKGETVG